MQYNCLRTFRRDLRLSEDSPKATPVMRKTYKSPVAKMAVTSIFFFSAICSFQRQGIGSIRITKSEMTLKIPVA